MKCPRKYPPFLLEIQNDDAYPLAFLVLVPWPNPPRPKNLNGKHFYNSMAMQDQTVNTNLVFCQMYLEIPQLEIKYI